MNRSAIDVAILCLDRPSDTQECIDSVLTQDHPDVRLWVLDQGSGRSMVDDLRARAKADGFTFVAGRRTGVAAGRNRACRMGSAPVIVALDNDAVLADPGVLSRVGERLAADKSMGALAFAVHDYVKGGPDAGSWVYPWPVETHFQREFPAARFCGAGHAVTRAAFEAVGGYDERLFFFGEEIDLSWSMIAAGYRIRYVPDIAVRHKSSPEQRIDWRNGRFYYNTRNMVYLLRKYLPKPGLLAAYVAGYLLKGLRNGLLVEALRGIRDGLRLGDGDDRPRLDQEACAYIEQFEFVPRGSTWQRLRTEVWPRLR